MQLTDEELRKLRDTNSFLRKIVSDMKVDLKKYEIEVDMLNEENH